MPEIEGGVELFPGEPAFFGFGCAGKAESRLDGLQQLLVAPWLCDEVGRPGFHAAHSQLD